MKEILGRIEAQVRDQPNALALIDSQGSLDYASLWQAVERLAAMLEGERIAYLLSNGSAWALVDLAVAFKGAAGIPIPTFFSDRQLAHLLKDAAPDCVITDQPGRIQALLQQTSPLLHAVAGRDLAVFTPARTPTSPLPLRTAKLTYTSGTTGTPKGVCISGDAITRVTLTLSEEVAAQSSDRALSLLPLATLLENIGGLYAPLVNGATACVPDLVECGMTGSSGVQPQPLLAALHRFAPTSIILVPQLLKVLVETCEAGAAMPASLRFIAVGGAPVSTELIRRARVFGLPVYQGYGLSESASVVSLNIATADRIGSVGRVLPHVRVRIAADGEIEVRGNLFTRYLGGAVVGDDYWPTGDLGYLDADGYLFITGRKQTTFATAFGRNVAPEWVESELTGSGAILQAAVFGAGMPFSVGVIVPHPRTSPDRLAQVIETTNQRLPDYARLRAWTVVAEPFSAGNGLANAAGVINRAAIAAQYAPQIDNLYAGA